MFIAEIHYPGTWVEATDKDRAWDTKTLFTMLEMTLARAAVSLNRFRVAQDSLDALTRDALEAVNANVEREPTEESPRLVQQVQKHRRPPSWDEDENRHLQVEMSQRRAKWAAGKWPGMYVGQEPALHAISFVLNLDRIGRLLEAFDALWDGREAFTTSTAKKFWGRFPTLRDLRDSVAHFDERIQWRVRKTELQPAAVDLPGVKSGAGNLLLENLRGDMLGATLMNGEYGEVEISEASLILARDSIQEAVGAVAWSGPPQLSPF